MKTAKAAFVLLPIFFNSINLISENNLRFATVCVPIADIRDVDPKTNVPSQFDLPENSQNKSIFCANNIQQKTQVLFGDVLKIIRESGEWVLVQIPSQRYFDSANKYLPVDGWITKRAITKKNVSSNKSNLVTRSVWTPIFRQTKYGNDVFWVSMGTRLSGNIDENGDWIVNLLDGTGKIGNEYVENIPNQNGSIKSLRAELVNRAKFFISTPYIWGGCSAPVSLYPDKITANLAHIATGVDCSGLIHVLFKSLGLQCPRNSNDQYLFSVKVNKNNEPITGRNLKCGDLIFFAKVASDGKTPLRMNHVAIYIGQNDQAESLIIEGQGTVNPCGVRIASTKKLSRLGFKNVSEIKTGDIYTYYDEVLKLKLKSYIHLGTFFTPTKLLEMRKDFFTSASLLK